MHAEAISPFTLSGIKKEYTTYARKTFFIQIAFVLLILITGNIFSYTSFTFLFIRLFNTGRQNIRTHVES